ncbi:MAG: asparaginase [Pseudomonadota bacterium]
MAANPVLVEVTRGDYVESRHTGAIAISDPHGKLVACLGDICEPIYPRSAIKPLQALYLAESGAVDGFGLEKSALALASSSHNGEEAHRSGVSAMLSAAGLGEDNLECGTQWPRLHADRAKLMKSGGSPGRIYNNCSGKHAGFLAAARHLGEETKDYIKPGHAAQGAIRGILEEMMALNFADSPVGTDGCSIPTYAVPLANMALGMAKMAAPDKLSPGRGEASRAIVEACFDTPHLVAGTGRFDTEFMTALGTLALVKTGAEGVYGAVLPDLGLGVALKCDDGATRASEVIMAGVLLALFEDEEENINPFCNVTVRDRNQTPVGTVRLKDGVLEALRN